MRWVPACIVMTAACGVPAPQYPSTLPPRLPSTGAQLAPEAVHVSFGRYTWQQMAGNLGDFPVGVSAPGGNPPLGTTSLMGMVRSATHPVDPALMSTLFCTWGPGDCDSNSEAERAHALMTAAVGELREHAAAAGADAVRQVRCFARGRDDRGRLWCEGEAVALAGDGPPLRPASGEIEAGAEPASSIWSLGASASAGVYGSSFVLGTTLHLRRGPLELAFHMVAPPDHGAAVLGFELLGRTRVGLGANVAYGAAGMLLSPLDRGGTADNAGTEAAVMPVLGVGKLFDLTFFGGYAKPFLDLRGGWLLSSGDGVANGHELDGLSVELVIGLTTP